ncbi:DUF2239 family protein [Paraglaciecola arctica]|uniref:DUF2239 domain-containing protein n=1 Tax=Paraglaciecola arctica BSs20135 TaxID=493475 RepID=K6XKS3_9ALTE|nr:DUF2239 family protein [Paraglaciecola arctica]GAC21254.1 hypothetical protein GARC_4312 [Paraglaciecola arctica BSs20135]
MNTQYLAIYHKEIISRGSLEDIIHQVKVFNSNIEPMVFEVETCRRIDFSWYGDGATVLANASTDNSQSSKRGRPKLGVKAKEVTLLPRHWEWLSTQKGGASSALRRLVDEAQKNASTEDVICGKQQQLDKFMLAFLGDDPGFEEASRALYRNSKVSFEAAIKSWPADIKDFVMSKFMEISDLHSGVMSA